MDDPSTYARQIQVSSLAKGRAMKYEVKHSRYEREWVVEAFNPKDDGEVYVAEFSGPNAKARATEYAAWKNSLDRRTVAA
jgi:hypothetical protein